MRYIYFFFHGDASRLRRRWIPFFPKIPCQLKACHWGRSFFIDNWPTLIDRNWHTPGQFINWPSNYPPMEFLFFPCQRNLSCKCTHTHATPRLFSSPDTHTHTRKRAPLTHPTHSRSFSRPTPCSSPDAIFLLPFFSHPKSSSSWVPFFPAVRRPCDHRCLWAS